MKESLKFNLTELKIHDTNSSCIMLVSKFSRAIKARHNITIQLRDENVLNKVAAYAAATDSSELKMMYLQLEDEIRDHLKLKNPNMSSDVVFMRETLATPQVLQ